MAEYKPKDPHIATAKRAAKERGYDGAIILFCNEDGKMLGASYGHTKTFCRRLGRYLDRVMDFVTTQ